MSNHPSIIDRWPTLAEFASDIGITYVAAKGMRHRERHGLGTIPGWYWLRVVRAARRRRIQGVTLEKLALLAEQSITEERAA